MRKTRKGKRILTIIGIVVIAIIILSIAIVLIVKNVQDGADATPEEQEQTAIELPNTTYRDMEVTDIYMEYLDSENQTMVTMSILNTTAELIENESVNAILIGADGNVLGQMQTWIQSLNAGEQYDISVIFNGNLTSTQSIQLQPVTE